MEPAAAARPELTELSAGLLQLLNLVLQHEHGHCERQQRQKLQLGRHHDSKQPHQTIHIECWVSSCSEEEEGLVEVYGEEKEEETLEAHTLCWWRLQSGRVSVHGPVSAALPVCLSPNVRVRWF